VWLRKLLTGLFDQELEIKYHFIRDMMLKGVMRLQYTYTDEKIADHPRHDVEGSCEAPIHIHR
jgi:hypothetical protein